VSGVQFLAMLHLAKGVLGKELIDP